MALVRRVVAVLLVGVGACACFDRASDRASARTPKRVVYYGDSLLVEATPFLHGAEVHAFPLTALCDWTDAIRQEVAERHIDVVVLVFSGNAATPCMRGIDWEQDRALARRYATDLAALKAAIAPVEVRWVRTPVKRDCCNGLQRLPYDIDAGAADEHRDGSYAQVLGGAPVRNADGVHFCPAPGRFTLPCTVDSPGARRFARALRVP